MATRGALPAHVPVVDAIIFHIPPLSSALVAGYAVAVAYGYGAVFALLRLHSTTFSMSGFNMAKT